MRTKGNFNVSHPIYGIWKATSLYGAAKTVGAFPSYLYLKFKKGKNTYKDWTIESTDEDFSGIPSKFVDATNEFVKEYYMDFISQLEQTNNDDDIEECFALPNE